MANRNRIQVDPGLPLPRIRPIASPVDTFVQPEQATKLDQLSSALARVSPQIAQFAGVVADRKNAADEEAGRQAAEKIRSEGLTMAEAVRKGKLPASGSKFFMAGLREQLGRNMADRMKGDLMVAAANDEQLSGSTDLKDFDKFATKFREDWVKQNIGGEQDSHFNTGFQFRANAHLDEARNSFAQGIESTVHKQADEATFSEVYQHAVDTFGKLQPEQIAADINTLTNSLIQTQGRNSVRTLKAAADAVATAAINSNSLAGAEVLKLLKGKTGPASAAVEQYDAVVTKISEGIYMKNRRDIQAAKDAQEKMTNDVLSEATQALIKDPHTDLTQYVSKLAGDPQAAEQLASLHRNVGALKYNTDEAVKTALFAGVWNGKNVTKTSVLRSLNTQKLTVEDANFLMEQIDKRDRASKEGNPSKEALSDFVFQKTLSNLRDRFTDPMSGVVRADLADKHAHAAAMLMNDWLTQVENGKAAGMSETDKTKWLTERADNIVRVVRGADAFSMDSGPKPNMTGKAGEPLPPLEKRLPPKGVLTPDDFAKFSRGIVTQNFRAQALQYNITQDEQADFIRSQMPLVLKAKKKP